MTRPPIRAAQMQNTARDCARAVSTCLRNEAAQFCLLHPSRGQWEVDFCQNAVGSIPGPRAEELKTSIEHSASAFARIANAPSLAQGS